jgi:hypothetical protein
MAEPTDWQKRAQDATRELAELRAALEDHATRWDQRAAENGDYYNHKTGEPAKYELGKAAVYDALASEVRALLNREEVAPDGA